MTIAIYISINSMGDIEDLLVSGALPCSRTQGRCPLPPLADQLTDPAQGPSASARVRQLMRHLSSSSSNPTQGRDCSTCPGHLHRRTTASASAGTEIRRSIESADLGRWLEDATDLPVRPAHAAIESTALSCSSPLTRPARNHARNKHMRTCF